MLNIKTGGDERGMALRAKAESKTEKGDLTILRNSQKQRPGASFTKLTCV
jgi:hypothetical protein